MNRVAIQAIQAMIAPVVLMTAAAMVANGLLGLYGEINDRMRLMTREKLARLTGADETFSESASLSEVAQFRLEEIDAQLVGLRRRHRLIREAVQLAYLVLAVVVLGMLLIAIAVSIPSPGVGVAALCLVVTAGAVLLWALLLVAVVVRGSADAVDYEVERALRLETGPHVRAGFHQGQGHPNLVGASNPEDRVGGVPSGQSHGKKGAT